jgi:hypothetical protein
LLRETGTTYDDELDNMYAEAILVRTWIYFYLFRNYKEIPYLTSPYDSEAAELDIVAWLNSSSGLTVGLSVLENDALSAISLLAPEKVSETEFFNRASARALLAEMYLWENRYADAVNILLEAIASGSGNRFILDRDLENAKWANIFKGDETANDEIITRIVFDKGEKQENELLPLFAAHAVGGNQLNVTERIRTRFEGTHRFNGTFKSGLYVGKYTRSSDDPYTSDMPVLLYRAADLHLMLAEAYNRLGETQTALNLLNNGSDSLFTAGSKGIRGRVAMKSLKLTETDPEEIMLEMEDLIMLERSMELAFEGKRWYDILRIGIRRNSTDYIANKVMERFENPDSLGIRTYFADRTNWFLPVE